MELTFFGKPWDEVRQTSDPGLEAILETFEKVDGHNNDPIEHY